MRAARTRQRLDPNQELIGQGLANMGGSFFQAYPACGSFTGSAINLQAGAKTGFAMVFNATFVMLVLLFLTPLLYNLPKATLAIIIVLAVTSLITPKKLMHTWRASKADGIVAITTFVVTLLAAPHLDTGVMVGAGLAILLLPLIAMQFTNEVNWKLNDFIVAGLLLLGLGLILELVLRKIKKSDYKVAVIVVLILGFLLVWAELAVGVFGSPLAGN